jgi:hypothetical protein
MTPEQNALLEKLKNPPAGYLTLTRAECNALLELIEETKRRLAQVENWLATPPN